MHGPTSIVWANLTPLSLQFKVEVAWLAAKAIREMDAEAGVERGSGLLKTSSALGRRAQDGASNLITPEDVYIGARQDEDNTDVLGTAMRRVLFFIKLGLHYDFDASVEYSSEEVADMNRDFIGKATALLNKINNNIGDAFSFGTCGGTVGAVCEKCDNQVILSNDQGSIAAASLVNAQSKASFSERSGYPLLGNSPTVYASDSTKGADGCDAFPPSAVGKTAYDVPRLLGAPLCGLGAGNRGTGGNVQDLDGCTAQKATEGTNRFSTYYDEGCYCTDFSAGHLDTLVNRLGPNVQGPGPDTDGFPVWAIIVIAAVGSILAAVLVIWIAPGAACDGIRNSIGCGKVGDAGGSSGSKLETGES